MPTHHTTYISTDPSPLSTTHFFTNKPAIISTNSTTLFFTIFRTIIKTYISTHIIANKKP